MDVKGWFVQNPPRQEAMVPDGPIAYFLNGVELYKVRYLLTSAKNEINSPTTDTLIDAVEKLVDALQGMASPCPQIGDTVVLNSGGPNMKVVVIDYMGVVAEWDCEGTSRSSYFRFECIRKVR